MITFASLSVFETLHDVPKKRISKPRWRVRPPWSPRSNGTELAK